MQTVAHHSFASDFLRERKDLHFRMVNKRVKFPLAWIAILFMNAAFLYLVHEMYDDLTAYGVNLIKCW